MERRLAQDESACQRFGFQKGSIEFASCMMQRDQTREDRRTIMQGVMMKHYLSTGRVSP